MDNDDKKVAPEQKPLQESERLQKEIRNIESHKELNNMLKDRGVRVVSSGSIPRDN